MNLKDLTDEQLIALTTSTREEEKRRKIAEKESQAELAWKITPNNNLMIGLKDARSGKDPYKWSLLTPMLLQKLLNSNVMHDYLAGEITYATSPATNKYEKKV